MDNRRPTSENAPKPLNRTNNSSNEDRQYAPRRFPPRDNQFQPRNDRFQPRDDRQRFGTERVQNRDERPPMRAGGSNSTGSDNRFQPRDNRSYPPRPNTGTGFQPRPNDRNDRNDRNDQNDRFQPRGRFVPRGKTAKPWEKPPAPIVSELQVTDGKQRGKYLKATTSDKYRPTARRVRESLFRILFRRIRAARFLDLCAGSGTVGFEAISRGAIISTFVERSAQMGGFIKSNMETLGIKEGHGELHQIEVVPFLKRMAKRKRQWDIAYFNPPTDFNYDEVLDFFSRGAVLRPGGLLVVEHPKELPLPEKFGVMTRWRVVENGDTTLTLFEKKRM